MENNKARMKRANKHWQETKHKKCKLCTIKLTAEDDLICSNCHWRYKR